MTKAAIYYHFASKDDILMALHMRLHDFGKEALSRMTEEPVTLELWGELLDQIVGQMLAQRKLFLMHERNQAALEKLHREDHDAEHDDIQDKFRQVLADPGSRSATGSGWPAPSGPSSPGSSCPVTLSRRRPIRNWAIFSSMPCTTSSPGDLAGRALDRSSKSAHDGVVTRAGDPIGRIRSADR